MRTSNPYTQTCNIQETTKGPLAGYKVSVKDAIWVKGIESTASSSILKGFTPLQHATCVQKSLEAGATITGKTIQDEFGFGTFCTNTGKGYDTPTNPHDKERSTGGSSGGAALATATEEKHLAIAESTGGSIVTPAAFCGVVGVCPTYGRVSRYGLISYASSLDKIGTMGKTVDEAMLLLEAISGHDEKDETSSTKPLELDKSSEKKKIGILLPQGVDEEIVKRFEEIVEELRKQGIQTEPITLPYTEQYGLAAYYTIAMSEASTHLACLCGLRYGAAEKLEGNYNDYFTKVRSTHFGEETKRRILIGTYMRMSGYRDQYYAKALKVRQAIIKEYKKLFTEYAAIINPTTPTVAPRFDEIEKLTAAQTYAFDFLTVAANLAGLPHITIPIHKEGELPQGCMITTDHYDEGTLKQLGKLVEECR